MSGYVRLYRSVKDSWLRKDPLASHLFFTYFLVEATWKPETRVIHGQTIHLQVGDVVFGRHMAAEVCGMTEKQIRCATGRLLRRASIRASIRASTFSVYNVINFGTYQGQGPTEGPAFPSEPETQRATLKKLEEVEEQDKTKERPLRVPTPAAETESIPKPKFIDQHPPNLAEVTAYCQAKDMTLTAEEFFDRMERDGWRYGLADKNGQKKNRLRDWQAHYRNLNRYAVKDKPEEYTPPNPLTLLMQRERKIQ